MGFYAILCPRPSPAPEDFSCTVVQGYFSVVSRRFYPSEMYIMSQSLLSYLRIDTLSPSAPTTVAGQIPSHSSNGGTAEIHRGGPAITISVAPSILSGISATIVLHNSFTTPLVFLTGGGVGPASPLSGLQLTATTTPPPTLAGAAAFNSSEPFIGAQLRMAEVRMVIMLGSFFFGIAAVWGLGRV